MKKKQKRKIKKNTKLISKNTHEIINTSQNIHFNICINLKTLKAYIIKLTNFINNFITKFLEKLYICPTRYWIYILLVIFIIGRIIAFKEEFRNSYIHQINLSIISLICFRMLKCFNQLLNKIYKENDGINVYISTIVKRAIRWQKSPINFFIPIFPVYSFINSIYNMQYIPNTVIGFYAALMASFAYFISLICYFHLLIAICTIYKLTRLDIDKFSFSFPNDIMETPEWIRLIAIIYNKGQYAFFTVGVLFTTEYILLIPQDVNVLDSSGRINFSLSMDFWSTWIIIVIFIIIAFPVIWLCFRALLTKLCKKIDKKAKQELALIASMQNKTDILTIWSQYQLITNAVLYEKKIFKEKNAYPFLATGLSFFLNIIKLLDILGIPFGL